MNTDRTKSYSTMTEAVRSLKARGSEADFGYVDGAFHIVNSERAFGGEELSIVEHYRFEGISDPDDMSVLYAVEASDGTRGTIVEAFGVYANPEIGAALQKNQMQENR
jgi:hypothetical protein